MASALEFRVLDPSEWPLLVRDGIEPYATYGLPDPEHTILIAALQDGRIMGVSNLTEVVVNHWHIAPQARRSPVMVQGLWRETERILIERGVPSIHATVADANVDVQQMVEDLGYEPAEGRLYIIGVGDSILSGR